MEYEWDAGKALRNLRKHGVDFADAVIALEDENALRSRNETTMSNVSGRWVWVRS